MSLIKFHGDKMKNNNVLAISVLTAALVAPYAYADTTVSAPVEKTAIEKIVHDYIVNNPEVLVEASQALQAKQQKEIQKLAKSAIAEHGSTLVSGTLTIAGNPKGDVTLVEFFDYQCSHCIKMKPVINELIKKNHNLRVVFKEFPIFGKESEMASRVAIVAAMHGKYMQFQNEIFKSEQHLDEKTILAAARKIGLNKSTLKTEMDGKAVTDLLEESRKLAESIKLMGTPAFVVLATPDGVFKAGSKTAFIPGSASEETFQDLIDSFKK